MEVRELGLNDNSGIAHVTTNNYYNEHEVETLKDEITKREAFLDVQIATIREKQKLVDKLAGTLREKCRLKEKLDEIHSHTTSSFCGRHGCKKRIGHSHFKKDE